MERIQQRIKLNPIYVPYKPIHFFFNYYLFTMCHCIVAKAKSFKFSINHNWHILFFNLVYNTNCTRNSYFNYLNFKSCNVRFVLLLNSI